MIVPKGQVYRPLPPERVFRVGERVRFAPPAGAYSPHSAQHRHVGDAGVVVKRVTDSYVSVLFREGAAVLIDPAYLRRI